MSFPSQIQDGFHAIGVDVCKAQLDCDGGPGRQWSVPNTAAGIKALFAQLPAGAHLFCESTGGYEAGLRQAALMAQIPCTTLNAQRARRFAEAQGGFAKTDRADARLLREYGTRMPTRVDPVVPPALRDLLGLVTVREQLVKQKTQIANELEHYSTPLLRRSLEQVLRTLEKQVARLEAQARKITTQHPGLAARETVLRAQYGIGEVIATTLLTLLPELGTLSRQKIATLAGLAPFADDSGPSKGARHIRGGRTRVRRALYLAAVTAIREKGSPLPAFYLRLRATGKPSKVALIAAARKLLVYLNSQIAKLNLPPLLSQLPTKL